MRLAKPIILAMILAMISAVEKGEARSIEGYKERHSRVIRAVFGKYGAQAVRVAQCESGLATWATNGQYLGMFQMGSYARGQYGHSSDPWGQARAAYRYFVDSGRDWSPWSCKPW